MKIRVKLLLCEMKKRGLTKISMAQKIGINIQEVEKLLEGEAVKRSTALEFICYFGADKAQELIDWEAIGTVNPLACEADEEGEL